LRAAAKHKKSALVTTGALLTIELVDWSGNACSLRTTGARRHLTDLEPGEPLDHYVFTEVRDRLLDHVADGQALVLDVMLLVKAVFLIELFHLAVHDFFNYLFGLAGCTRLNGINLALFVEHFLREFLAAHIAWVERGNVHRHIVAKLLERLSARHEIRLAVNLHKYANLAAGVDVATHEAFTCFSHGFLGRCGLPFLPKDADGLFDVATCFDERGATIGKTGVGALAKLLNELSWDLHCWLLCTHPFSLFS